MSKQLFSALLFSTISSFTFAEDITGLWQSIDDKTGAPKGLVEIRKEVNGTYTGKIVKITPRAGYIPQRKYVWIALHPILTSQSSV